MDDVIKQLFNLHSLAVMGGTFDPIHIGHLCSAETVRQQFGFDKVLFIPSGMPPHKKLNQVTSASHRYLMTLFATLDNPNFVVSDLEIKRQGHTYTIDTLMAIEQQLPNTKVYFITGADAIFEILDWKDSEKLLSICELIAITRPGYDTKLLKQRINSFKDEYESRIHYIEVPALDISSSQIRQSVKEKKSVRYLVPNSVWDYIFKNGLYQ